MQSYCKPYDLETVQTSLPDHPNNQRYYNLDPYCNQYRPVNLWAVSGYIIHSNHTTMKQLSFLDRFEQCTPIQKQVVINKLKIKLLATTEPKARQQWKELIDFCTCVKLEQIIADYVPISLFN